MVGAEDVVDCVEEAVEPVELEVVALVVAGDAVTVLDVVAPDDVLVLGVVALPLTVPTPMAAAMTAVAAVARTAV